MDVLDAFQHTLARKPRHVAVAQLKRLVLARARA